MQSPLPEKILPTLTIDACEIAVLLSFIPFIKTCLFTRGYFERKLEFKRRN